jgi:hypothetical protein
LKIFFGEKSQALLLAETAVRNVVRSPETFLTVYTDQITAALKRPKTLSHIGGGENR